jgi:hypothetical protein
MAATASQQCGHRKHMRAVSKETSFIIIADSMQKQCCCRAVQTVTPLIMIYKHVAARLRMNSKLFSSKALVDTVLCALKPKD